MNPSSHPVSRLLPGKRSRRARSEPRVLILGYGNTLRGDDGAGPLAAEAVAALGLPGVTVETHHQLTPDLAALVATFDHVAFIDAEQTPDETNLIPARIREISPGRISSSRPSLFGHHQDPSALVALAGQLFGRTPRAWLVSIAARSFELGARPTMPCARGIAEAVKQVKALVNGLAAERRASMRAPAAVSSE